MVTNDYVFEPSLVITKIIFAIFLLCKDPRQIAWLICLIVCYFHSGISLFTCCYERQNLKRQKKFHFQAEKVLLQDLRVISVRI